MGIRLNLKNPQTFNEKLQWLKLYDRNPEYTKMVDKYEVRKYIAEKIGEEYLIPFLGVWDRFDDIDFDKLPDQFVLKCTHDSGGVVICKDKSKLDIEETRKKINRCLKRDFYKLACEWPYKNVKPRIIAEKFMVDELGAELKDYKFFGFNGKVKIMYVASDRENELKFDFFDADFNPLNLRHGYPNSKEDIKKPDNFSKMVSIAERLSENIPQLRVDLYSIGSKIYFGELTFFHHAGMVPFDPEEWDKTFGDWIELPE